MDSKALVQLALQTLSCSQKELARSIRDGAGKGCGERLRMLMTRRSVALSMTRGVPGGVFGG
jgi:hypothetical protein